MDLTQARAQLTRDLSKLSDAKLRASLLGDFEALAAAHPTAPDKPSVEARIAQLLRHASLAGGGPSQWSYFSISLISGVVIAFFLSIWMYFYGLGPDRYASIEATRPMLVLTLIICMLGFGGLLIVRSLFSSEPAEHYERRFRLAREVFLVFAGIFGTIIGFYFGAADGESERSVSLDVEWAEGVLTARTEGGSDLFYGVLMRAGQPDQPLAKRDGLLTVEVTPCPEDALVVAFTGDGRRTEGKVACEESGADGDAATNNVQDGEVVAPPPAGNPAGNELTNAVPPDIG
jgi:hypothetical protein